VTPPRQRARAAPPATPQSLEAAFRGGADTPPLALAAGPSDYWRDRVVAAFRHNAATAGAEFLRLEGDELDGDRLAGELQSLSLFSTTRRLWIREAGKIQKPCEELLLAWADAPTPDLAILVTTAREPSELKFLAALAERAATAACVEKPSEARREAARLIEAAGLRLPGPAQEALAARAGSLQALQRECDKLALLATPEGTLPARAFESVAAGRTAASVERWAAAALRGDGAATRAESFALDLEGASGGNALWAVASIALAALEPASFAYRRGPAGPALGAPRARAVLDAVYRADRGMKRGDIRDAEIRDVLERILSGGIGGGGR
jgi:hypothetical protein